MKLGCCIGVAELKIAYDCGYDFVDFSGKELVGLSWNKIRCLSEFITEKGIHAIGIHAAFPREIALTGDRYDEMKLRQYIKKLVERAGKLGVCYIGVGSPDSRYMEKGIGKEDADRQMVESLNLICEEASDFEILLENLNKNETNYINSLQEAFDICKQVKYDNIGLVWDIYHFMKSDERIENLSAELLSQIKYLHIADPVERQYPSKNSSKQLFEVMREAIVLSEAKYLAVEAVSKNPENDMLHSQMILRRELRKSEE